ncbi:DUF2285 domain-containing protein [Sphingobium sp. AS12]|uniref:DNA -binding domain-containing protein n=1 Tax=Sphingobium sp. AS12 TaxID=2849495 RepID=UPI001C312B03|nr:DUF2285 domain-containing protein [Sphingobium sp. AS12]
MIEVSGPRLDLSRVKYRAVVAENVCHLLIDLPSGTLQLLVRGADVLRGDALSIVPQVDLGRPLDPQLREIRRLAKLVDGVTEGENDQRLARLVDALRVGDALREGASQRDIALGIYGGDWPGDGEHLKSRVRRMIPLACALVRAGPRAVLAGRI